MSYEIVDLLMRLNESGTTVIMVTHEHSLVRCFDKRVIVLEKGTIVSDGTVLNHEAATSHINPASEISTESAQAPEEDYSVYAERTAEEITVEELPDDDEELDIDDIIAEELSEGGEQNG